MYGPGAQSDDVLIFFEDGKGRLDFHNPVLCNAWSFHWSILDDRTIHVVGDLAYHCDGRVVTRSWAHDANHSITVREEATPQGSRMRVLRFSTRLIEGLSDHFAFCRPDVDEYAEPDFSFSEGL